MPLASFKLGIARIFFRDTNLSRVNEEFCSTARLTWLLMDRRRTNLIVISSQPQWTCLQAIAFWVDTRKDCGPHSATSAVCADPLRKRRLLCTSSVNARPIYHLLTSRIWLRLLNFLAGLLAWGSRAFDGQPLC